MHNLVQIFICPVHGEVDAERLDIIDTERDDCWVELVCSVIGCTMNVKPKLGEGQSLCYREKTIDEKAIEDLLVFDLYG